MNNNFPTYTSPLFSYLYCNRIETDKRLERWKVSYFNSTADAPNYNSLYSKLKQKFGQGYCIALSKFFIFLLVHLPKLADICFSNNHKNSQSC